MDYVASNVVIEVAKKDSEVLTKQVVKAADEEMKTLEMPKSESRKEKGEVKC